MFQDILEGFDFDTFDVPVMLVPFPCPVDLGRLNKELTAIGGYEQDVLDERGERQPRLRARWGGTERSFFCENDIFKYLHRAKKDPCVGVVVYDEAERRWVGPLPNDIAKWGVAIQKKHGASKGARWCQRYTRHLLNCKVRDGQPAFVCVGRWRVYLEQWVHPDVLRTGWEQIRWHRELGGAAIEQQTIDEYNDWTLYAKRLKAQHAEMTDRRERRRVIQTALNRFKLIARKPDQPKAEGPLDLPFELRSNLTIRRRDILGPLPEFGTYEQLFVVQKEDGGYKPPDEEVLTIARYYIKRDLEDALVKGVAPGHATPSDQMADRVANIYRALREADQKSKEARAEADREDGFTASQLVMTGEGPRIITEF